MRLVSLALNSIVCFSAVPLLEPIDPALASKKAETIMVQGVYKLLSYIHGLESPVRPPRDSSVRLCKGLEDVCYMLSPSGLRFRVNEFREFLKERLRMTRHMLVMQLTLLIQ